MRPLHLIMAVSLLTSNLFASEQDTLPLLDFDVSSDEKIPEVTEKKVDAREGEIPLFHNRYRFYQTSNLNALCRLQGLGNSPAKVVIQKWHEADWGGISDYFVNKTMAVVDAQGNVLLRKFPRNQLNFIAELSCSDNKPRDYGSYRHDLAKLLIAHKYEVDYADIAKLKISPELTEKFLEVMEAWLSHGYRATGITGVKTGPLLDFNKFKQGHYDIALETIKAKAKLDMSKISLLP